ncbi:MAG: hypothetical protein WAL91_03625 [Propionicimonas sp.]
MSTQPTEPHWEQPSFSPHDTGPVISGVVLAPGERPLTVVPLSREEHLLRTMRRLVWPVALVLAILTGDWVPLLVLAILAGALVKARLRHLRAERIRTQGIPSGLR